MGAALAGRLNVTIHCDVVPELDRYLGVALRAQVCELLGLADERDWEQRPWRQHLLAIMGALPEPWEPLATTPTWNRAVAGYDNVWIAYLTAGRDVLDIRYSHATAVQLELWSEVMRSCGWLWPFQHICLISERPAAIHWDAQERLHHPSEASLRYRDGFQLFFWHGTRVPEEWITNPRQLDPRKALDWRSLEERLAAAEIIGWTRVIELLGPRTIDRDPDRAVGELLEVTLPQVGPARFLRVRCGTGREFVLRVPPHVSTARQANSWTYGLESEDYQLEART
jgi:hypothetical protein